MASVETLKMKTEKEKQRMFSKGTEFKGKFQTQNGMLKNRQTIMDRMLKNVYRY